MHHVEWNIISPIWYWNPLNHPQNHNLYGWFFNYINPQMDWNHPQTVVVTRIGACANMTSVTQAIRNMTVIHGSLTFHVFHVAFDGSSREHLPLSWNKRGTPISRWKPTHGSNFLRCSSWAAGLFWTPPVTPVKWSCVVRYCRSWFVSSCHVDSFENRRSPRIWWKFSWFIIMILLTMAGEICRKKT